MPKHRRRWCQNGLHDWQDAWITRTFAYEQCRCCGLRRASTLSWGEEDVDQDWIDRCEVVKVSKLKRIPRMSPVVTRLARKPQMLSTG